MPSQRTLADLGWDQLLEAWRARCHTELGIAEVDGALGRSRGQAEASIRCVSQARELRAAGNPLEFGGISDITDPLARADKGAVLEAAELLAVADAARGFDRLREVCARHPGDAPDLHAIAGELEPLGDVFHPIHEAFGPDGRLVDHASDALGSLRRKVVTLTGRLEDKARRLVDDPRIGKHLQDQFYTQRDDRYVVPVRIEARARVPGIVHGTSQSGQTVFVEPQDLVELGNELKLAECAVADEERRIYQVLTGYVAEDAGALRDGVVACRQLDVIDGAARLAEELEAVAVQPSDGGGLRLPQARHPLMELSERDCVPNDIVLGPGQIMVISGPNAGGKTVALKTAGLCALMVRAGLHLPVGAGADPSIAWFDDVFTEIGDSQSLESDLSTFSGHLLHLGDILRDSGAGSLVLVDEIAVGTEPEQGAALAQAVLEVLAEREVPTIVTTHFEKLKALAGDDPRFVNASVGFDLEAMEPTFRLHLGTPGTSGALALAKRMGIDARILTRSEELVGTQTRDLETMLAELADARRKLDDERAELAAATASMERESLRAKEAAAKADARRRAIEDTLHGDGLEALRMARIELDRARSAIKKAADQRQLRAAGKRVDAASRKLRGAAPQKQLPGREARDDEIVIGAEVFVPSLGGSGLVVADPIKGRVAVKVGALRVTADVGELRIVAGGGAKRPARSNKSYELSQTADDEERSSDPQANLDVRGQRVDEALARVDRFIDDSLLQNRAAVCVIHGHGSGALRRAIREHLSSHPAIASASGGAREQGGDGVTVAKLA